MLRRILRPKRAEVTGEWIKLHNEELNDLYSSANMTEVIRSRRIRWAGHVPHMRERRGAYSILMVKPEERVHLEDPGVDGRIILK